MIKRILVPTDGSETAAIGVRYAVALARKHAATILALHVVDVKLLEGPFLRDLSASLGAAPYVNYQGNITMLLDERGRLALKYTADLCKEHDVPCETELITGLVPRVIVEKGELTDLIVIGRAGEHNEFLEGLIGSTTEAVVRRASTPVVVTGQETPGDADIVLAYDGSSHARQALRAGARLAGDQRRHLRVLAVGEKHAATWLEEARDYLQPHAPEATYTSISGQPGESIVSHARETKASLIVMGAYGHNKLRELVLGSTTSHVINHAPCPTLLVR